MILQIFCSVFDLYTDLHFKFLSLICRNDSQIIFCVITLIVPGKLFVFIIFLATFLMLMSRTDQSSYKIIESSQII